MSTIIIFILVLGVLVLVHELGHFIAAKKSGCNVEEFGIGFPPRLFSFRKKETLYTINLLPIGGFVKIQGENGEDTDDPRSFSNKPLGWKALIVTAGVIMNIFLAYVLISIGLIAGVPTVIDEEADFGRFARLDNQQIAIVEVLEDSPASEAQFQSGDVILTVNNEAPEDIGRLQSMLSAEPAQATNVQIKRGDEVENLTVIPEQLPDSDRLGIGVALAQTAELSYPWYVAWLYGIERTFTMLWFIISAFGTLIAQLLAGQGVGAELAGPIGIAVLTGEVARVGFVHLLQFTAILSLNLAIINILPFPALDGSRLALVILEKVRNKRLNVRLENLINIVGFGALMVLMLLVTLKDISTYGAGIWESLKGFFG